MKAKIKSTFFPHKACWVSITGKALTLAFLLFLLAGCGSGNRPSGGSEARGKTFALPVPESYRLQAWHSQEDADTLLVDMVTYIGRKPPLATAETRFDPEFRGYYQAYAGEFEIIYYFVQDSGTHWYYLIRPARSLHGNRRGVGGMFRLENGRISGFEELFNTPVMDEDRIRLTGLELFEEMLQTGHVERFLRNSQYIEWPDERLKYDKEKFEWRYGQ